MGTGAASPARVEKNAPAQDSAFNKTDLGPSPKFFWIRIALPSTFASNHAEVLIYF
jgi:hypothetical protein